MTKLTASTIETTAAHGLLVAYIRVSTVDQNTARQREAIAALNPKKVYEDHCSGKNTDRPALKECLSFLREGDTLVVHSIDRLCRNTADLLNLVSDLSKRGIVVRFLKEGIDTSAGNPMSQFLLTILGAVAAFERELIHERQLEGIAIAKAEGKYKGRKPSLSAEQKAEALARIKAGVPKAVVARELGVSRQVIYNAISEAVEDRTEAA